MGEGLADAGEGQAGEGLADDALGHEGGDVAEPMRSGRTSTTLTALVDGLSNRWLAGALDRERARELLDAAIAAELAADGWRSTDRQR